MAEFAFYDPDTAKLIAEHVQADRRGVQGQGPASQGPRYASGERWAKIKGYLSGTGKYSWVAVKPDKYGKLEEFAEWGSGDCEQETGYARELGGCKDCPPEQIVRLWPSLNQEFYLFQGPSWFGELKSRMSTADYYQVAYVLEYDDDAQWVDGKLDKWPRIQDDEGVDVERTVVASALRDSDMGEGTRFFAICAGGRNVILVAGCP